MRMEIRQAQAQKVVVANVAKMSPLRVDGRIGDLPSPGDISRIDKTNAQFVTTLLYVQIGSPL